MSHVSRGALRTATVLALATTAASCSYVKTGDFETEMDRVRAEMLTGDQAVEQDLTGRLDGMTASLEALEQRMDRVESELQNLAEEFDASVQRLESALRFAAPVHFEFDDATVRTEDMELLQRFSMVVKDYYPEALITVEGFTDPSGSAAYNLQLGQRRADAVRAVLVDQGRLDPEGVRSVSYGEDTSRLVDPSAKGPGTPGATNRRVVLVIDHATEAMDQTIVTSGGETR
jgi:peptidoglycan-associated lipoprotein